MIHTSIPKAALRVILLLAVASAAPHAFAQSLGSAGTVTGVVTDPNGAVVPGAVVKIENPVTGYNRTVNTDKDGAFRFGDVPPNTYQLTAAALVTVPYVSTVSTPRRGRAPPQTYL